MKEFKERWKVQESLTGKDNFNIVGEIPGYKYKIARVPFMVEQDGITKEGAARLKEEALHHATIIANTPNFLRALQAFCDKCNEYNIEALAPEYEQAMTLLNKALS